MKKLYLAITLGAVLVSSAVMAQDMSREDIEAIVKDYIENNPEVILNSVEAYGRQQQAAEFEAQQEAVKANMDWIENNESLPVEGNPEGDVTIVEFFDYNCGYCKKALEDVLTLMEEDDNLKFVFVDMPILGPSSRKAAEWSMAAKEQNAFLEYHAALMQSRGMINEQRLEQIAENIGLDVEQMRQDAASEEVEAIIREKMQKASAMGISGTPAFIIGGQLYGGYIGLERMREAVAEARENAEIEGDS